MHLKLTQSSLSSNNLSTTLRCIVGLVCDHLVFFWEGRRYKLPDFNLKFQKKHLKQVFLTNCTAPKFHQSFPVNGTLRTEIFVEEFS